MHLLELHNVQHVQSAYPRASAVGRRRPRSRTTSIALPAPCENGFYAEHGLVPFFQWFPGFSVVSEGPNCNDASCVCVRVRELQIFKLNCFKKIFKIQKKSMFLLKTVKKY